MSSIDPSFRGMPRTIGFYGEGQSKSFTPESAVFGVAAHEAQNHRYFEGVAAAAGGYVMGSTTTFDVRWDPVAKRAVVSGGESRTTIVKPTPANGVRSDGRHVVIDPALNPNSPQNVGKAQDKRENARAQVSAAEHRTQQRKRLTQGPDRNQVGRLSTMKANLQSQLSKIDTELASQKEARDDAQASRAVAAAEIRPEDPHMRPAEPDVRSGPGTGAAPPPLTADGTSTHGGEQRSQAETSPREAALREAGQKPPAARPPVGGRVSRPPDPNRVKDLERRRAEISQRLEHVDVSLQKVSEEMERRLNNVLGAVVNEAVEQDVKVTDAARDMLLERLGGADVSASSQVSAGPSVPFQSADLPPNPVYGIALQDISGVGAPEPMESAAPMPTLPAPVAPTPAASPAAPLPTPTYTPGGMHAAAKSDVGFLVNNLA